MAKKPLDFTGVKIRVTLRAPVATEILRLAENLSITPDLFVERAMAEVLRREYGITTR